MVRNLIFIAALFFSLISNAQNFIEDSVLINSEDSSYIITQYMSFPIYREKSKQFSYIDARNSIIKDIDFNSFFENNNCSIIMAVFWVEENGSTSGHHIIYKDNIWHENLIFNPSINELLLKRLRKLGFDKPAYKTINQPVRFRLKFPLWINRK